MLLVRSKHRLAPHFTTRAAYDLADFIVFGGYVSNEGDGGLLHSDGTPHGLWHHGSRPSVIECTCRAIVLVQNPFEGFKNVVLRDYVAPLTSGVDGSLSQEIHDLGGRETVRRACYSHPIDWFLDVLPSRMHQQLVVPPRSIGLEHVDDAIEAAWANECLVQGFESVGCSHNHHPTVAVETVHLSEKCVDDAVVLPWVLSELINLVPSFLTDPVELVDEDDARRKFAGLVKDRSDSFGTDTTNNHVEIRGIVRKERHSTLPGNSFGHQGLARARGPAEENAGRCPGTRFKEVRRIRQELHDHLDLLLDLIYTGKIVKRGVVLPLALLSRSPLPSRHLPWLVHIISPGEDPNSNRERDDQFYQAWEDVLEVHERWVYNVHAVGHQVIIKVRVERQPHLLCARPTWRCLLGGHNYRS
mmetsp:Transcript_12892/g.38944  ORF Transcript_12892/g.38944 Transcript_12892/m.38944 type:complete len:415 (+) Transcript_12892:3491-4735(+)